MMVVFCCLWFAALCFLAGFETGKKRARMCNEWVPPSDFPESVPVPPESVQVVDDEGPITERDPATLRSAR